MNGVDLFDVRCGVCGEVERFTYASMQERTSVLCVVCGTVRDLCRESLIEICRDAALRTGSPIGNNSIDGGELGSIPERPHEEGATPYQGDPSSAVPELQSGIAYYRLKTLH